MATPVRKVIVKIQKVLGRNLENIRYVAYNCDQEIYVEFGESEQIGALIGDELKVYAHAIRPSQRTLKILGKAPDQVW